MRETRPATEMYHPWRHLQRAWWHVDVDHVDDIADDRLGETDGIQLIRLRRRQLQVERRCTLTHELIHLERGDEGECSPATEAEIDREAARRLIPWDFLIAAVRWAHSEEELADELWVSVKILRARAETFTWTELVAIAAAASDAHVVEIGE